MSGWKDSAKSRAAPELPDASLPAGYLSQHYVQLKAGWQSNGATHLGLGLRPSLPIQLAEDTWPPQPPELRPRCLPRCRWRRFALCCYQSGLTHFLGPGPTLEQRYLCSAFSFFLICGSLKKFAAEVCGPVFST